MGVAYAIHGERRGFHDAFGEYFKRIEQGRDPTACPIENQVEKMRGERER
jgi:hypothetical protein